MTDADRQRLAAILGMLGSEHAGERAAAGLQAEAFRKKHGLTWRELVESQTIYVDRIVERPVYRDREAPLEPPRPSRPPPYPDTPIPWGPLAARFTITSLASLITLTVAAALFAH